MTRASEPAGRPRNPAWAVLWLVGLLAAEWIVLRFHYGDWRANSPRTTWVLEYGCMLAIGVGFLLMTQRLLSDSIYRGGRAFLIVTGGLVCVFNLLTAFLTFDEAWPEVRDGVDSKRVELARLRGSESDIVVYEDSARAGVLVDSVCDAMVQHHALRWQNKLLRWRGNSTVPKLERHATGARLVLLDRWKETVVSVIPLDWE